MAAAKITHKPPDGGWGWVIVAAVFFIEMLSFGAAFTIGIVFDVLMVEFDCSKSEVGAMASIAYGLECMLAPVASLLFDRFGARKVCFAGCLISALSLILSAFAWNIIYLYVVFGIFGGVGLCLHYLAEVVIISHYFDSKISIATSIGITGAFIGCFVYPYLMQLLKDEYGWRGCLFITGALALNAPAIALLIRPIKHSTIKKRTAGSLKANKTTESKAMPQNGSIDLLAIETLKNQKETTRLTNGRKIPSELAPQDTTGTLPLEVPRHVMEQQPNSKSMDIPPLYAQRGKDASKHQGSHRFQSLDHLPGRHFLSSLSVQLLQTSYGDLPMLRAIQEEETSDHGDVEPKKWAIYGKLLLNPRFTVFVFSNGLIASTVMVPSLYMVDWGNKLGISAEFTAACLSFYGVGNTIGRPLVALVADRHAQYRRHIFVTLVAVAGAATIILPFYANRWTLAVLMIQFAFLVGGSQSLLTPILVEFLSLTEISTAFGLLLMVEGIGFLSGPPLFGLFWAYESTFTTTGIVLVIAAAATAMEMFAEHLKTLSSCQKASNDNAAPES